MSSNNQYFATLPPKELMKKLLEWNDNFFNYIRITGRLSLWRNAYYKYYRARYTQGYMVNYGEQMQYTKFYTNHYHNLLTHIKVLTSSQNFSYDAKAANTDYESQSQTIVGNNVMEYYRKDKRMGVYMDKSLEQTLNFADAYLLMEWDTSLGTEYMADEVSGTVLKTGDVYFKNFNPIDVVFDYTVRGNNKRNWYLLTEFVNKYDLAVKYPELKDKIISINYKDSGSNSQFRRFETYYNLEDGDCIPLYKFYHDRTPSVPNGKYFCFVGDDCDLINLDLPYDRIPVYRLSPSEQEDTGFGYTIGFDLLGLQQAIDALHSVIITNQLSFGIQNILVPESANLTLQSIKDGLNIVKYQGNNPPSSLDLLRTPREIFEYIVMLENTMQTLSGINSVARGNPEASLKSGAALALVQSMAIQFNSDLQKSFINFIEEIGTGLIDILKRYAKTPIMISIAGKSNRSYMKEFTNKDISNINRVSVDVGNPLSRTTAGKVNIADSLLQAQLIKVPQEYFQVISTGRLEPMFEGDQAELMLIRSENEKLSEGIEVPVLFTDRHDWHIPEHKITLASPEARADPKVTEVCLAHIQWHMSFQNPMPQNIQTQSTTSPEISNQFNAENPTMKSASTVLPGMPSMPTNPLTNKEFNVATGGL